MIHSSNRLNALSTSGLGSAICEPDTTFGKKAAYPQPDKNASLSWNCENGRCTSCTKLTCPCECHNYE